MRRIAFILAGVLALTWFLGEAAWALDEDADAFAFLPSDASMVMAIDTNELGSYGISVARGWRDADRAHFASSLGMLSNFLTEKTGRPDVLTFLGGLSGVQAAMIDPLGDVPLMVFSASSDRDRRLLRNYTAAYIVEQRYREAIDAILDALRGYYYHSEEDPETGEAVIRHAYPESLEALIEEGYLDELPINPYTGRPMKAVAGDEPESLGDISYRPCRSSGVCCGGFRADEEPCDDETDAEAGYTSFKLISYHIGGVLISERWRKDFKPYDDLAERLSELRPSYTWQGMGFTFERDGDWEYFTRDDANYAFASGERFLLFGNDVDELKEAVARSQNGGGFHFSPPDDFDTSGAFYRDEADLSTVTDQMNSVLGDMPPCVPMMEELIHAIGLDALSRQHTACWLRRGNIESVRRLELTGEAQRTLVGSMVYAPPAELMTTEDGPFDIIGEFAWANPGDYAQAFIDFALEFVLPMIASEMGMEGMDQSLMLGMVGLGDLDALLSDEMYILFTGSEDRGDGLYLPGVVAAYRTDNPDLGYILVGMYDSLSFMVPDFPLYLSDLGDETSATWLMTNEECPISPTVAWCEGWVVESLWREDALAARDALAAGTLLAPDGLDPANMRVRVNRRALLHGLADMAYGVPEPQIAPVGAVFDLFARLSGPDERLFAETTGTGEYVETRCQFSLGLCEELLPALAYLIRGAGAFGPF